MNPVALQGKQWLSQLRQAGGSQQIGNDFSNNSRKGLTNEQISSIQSKGPALYAQYRATFFKEKSKKSVAATESAAESSAEYDESVLSETDFHFYNKLLQSGTQNDRLSALMG